MKQHSSPNPNRVTRAAGLAAGCLVSGVAAIASYTHMRELAFNHGQGALSYLIPLSVDGMILAASLAIVTARRMGTNTPWLAWMALVVGVLVSLAANVAAALPDATSRLISAWPPLAFAVAFELILRVIRSTDTTRAGGAGEGLESPAGADLFDRAMELVARGEAQGIKVGRGTLQNELSLSEHQARRLLHQVRQSVHQRLQAVGDES